MSLASDQLNIISRTACGSDPKLTSVPHHAFMNKAGPAPLSTTILKVLI